MKVLSVEYNKSISGEQVCRAESDKIYRLYVFYDSAEVYRNDHSKLQINSNEALFISCSEGYRIIKSSDELRYNMIECTLTESDEYMVLSMDIPIGESMFLEREDIISHIIFDCSQIYEMTGEYDTPMITQLLVSIIFCMSHMIRKNDKANALEIKHPQIAKLHRMIFDHPEEEWNIKRMSDITGYSESRLQTLYKQIYTVSCMEDVLRNKIRYSRHLLITTSKSLDIIAKECGFNSYEHFARTFKRISDCTPSEFRKAEGIESL